MFNTPHRRLKSPERAGPAHRAPTASHSRAKEPDRYFLILGTAFNAAGKLTVLNGVAAAVNPIVTTALTTLGTSLAAATAPVVTMIGNLLNALQAILSLKVNVQPDQPDPPTSPTARTGEYQAVWLAQSWAGPDTELP